MASKELFAAFVMHKTKRLLVGKSLTVFLEENTEKQENAHHYFSIGKHVDPYSPLQRILTVRLMANAGPPFPLQKCSFIT